MLRRQYQTKFAIPGILILDAQKKVLWSGSVAEFKNNDKEILGKSTNVKEKKVSFALHNIDRTKAVTHRDYMGKMIILNFFASWCPPCQKEIPHLNSYQKKLNIQKKDIQIIGILLDENLETARNYLAKKDFAYPVFLPDKAMIKKGTLEIPGIGRIKGIPLTVIINNKSEVSKMITGVVTEKELESAVHLAITGEAIQEKTAKKTPTETDTIQFKVDGMMKSKGAT